MRALALAALLAVTPVAAAGDIDVGKSGATACAGCHGMDGISVIPGYPNLAGQNEQYLVNQLKLFRSKERTGGNAAVMWGMAAGLDDDDIANLAAYFANLGQD